jgi:hypothetical protein
VEATIARSNKFKACPLFTAVNLRQCAHVATKYDRTGVEPSMFPTAKAGNSRKRKTALLLKAVGMLSSRF